MNNGGFRCLRAFVLIAIAFMFISSNAYADGVPDSGERAANSWRYSQGSPIIPEEELLPEPLSSRLSIPYKEGRGIDVSSWQKAIDWDKVKNDAGVNFAIIRAAAWDGKVDDCWSRNASECERLGIPYGAYIYSYAATVAEAESEADFVLGLLEGRSPTLPIYIDIEDNSTIGSDHVAIARAFCKKIEAAGYDAGVYANLNWWRNYLDNPILSQWSRWVAQYYGECTYQGSFDYWQYSSSETISGINTGGVDVNREVVDSFFDNPYSVDAFVGSSLVLDPDDYRSSDSSTVSLVATDGTVYSESDGVLVVPANSRALKLAASSAGSAGKSGYATGETVLNVHEDGIDTGRIVTVTLYIYATEFPDVDRDDWFASGDDARFDYATDRGLIQGYSNNGCFGPYDYLTRGQLATILWRMAGEPETASPVDFDDVNYDLYYGSAIHWARHAGVVSGFTGTNSFHPDDLVTREQLCCMLVNYVQRVCGSGVQPNVGLLDDFPDGSQVSSWARESVACAIGSGIMHGVQTGHGAQIQPAGFAWRASAGTMVAYTDMVFNVGAAAVSSD